MLDIGVVCRMRFRRDFFEELNDKIDKAVYFVDIFNIKPSWIGIIRVKLPGFLDFVLCDVFHN